VLGRPLKEINEGIWDVAAVSTLLAETLSAGVELDHTEVALTIPGNGRRRYHLKARLLAPEPDKGPQLLLAIEDADQGRG
jgi:hypothetical protein